MFGGRGTGIKPIARNNADAGFETHFPTSFVARAGAEAVNALTFYPDHPMGADHARVVSERVL